MTNGFTDRFASHLAVRWSRIGTCALALLASLFLMGCITHVDWASRVGFYSYDQAVREMGPPDKAAKLSDGTQVCEWLLYRGTQYYHGGGMWMPGNGLGTGGCFYLGPTSPDRFVRLIFAPDGKLSEWKKVYR